MRVMNSKTFGLRFSEKIVGGRARLERVQPSNVQECESRYDAT